MFESDKIRLEYIRKLCYELLKEPEHQTLQSSEWEKTDITTEKELSTYPKSKERAKEQTKHIKN